jgi:dimethylargininase
VALDNELAVRQHAEFCRLLRDLGTVVRVLDVNRTLPDSTFIEDTAIVLDEVAVLASMGAAARREEPAGIEPELRKYRPVQRVTWPATIEGGDVLRVGRTLFVGLSGRTNSAGVEALEAIVRPHNYRVVPVVVRGCLHLKSACTVLPDGSLLVNPSWLDSRPLREFEQVCIPEDEPWAANTRPLGRAVCLAADHVQTADMLRGRGFDVRTVSLSELAKAEGGITCLALLFDAPTSS